MFRRTGASTGEYLSEIQHLLIDTTGVDVSPVAIPCRLPYTCDVGMLLPGPASLTGKRMVGLSKSTIGLVDGSSYEKYSLVLYGKLDVVVSRVKHRTGESIL